MAEYILILLVWWTLGSACAWILLGLERVHKSLERIERQQQAILNDLDTKEID